MNKFDQPGVATATSRPGDGAGEHSRPRPAAGAETGVEGPYAAAREPGFVPARWLGNRHAQTIWPNQIRRDPAGDRLAAAATAAQITSEDGDALRLYWSSHEPREGAPRPVLIVLHGLTGSAVAENVLAVAAKGYGLGFDVVRIDLRNSQADDAPSLGVGHAGRSEDLRAVVDHVGAQRGGAATAVIGFSLGGNIALKAAGEYGDGAPVELRAVAAISVPIDLDEACTAIDEKRSNWIYRNYFLRRLGRRYLQAHADHPERFPALDVAAIRSIRAWDNAVVAPLGGFADAEDYYARASSLRVIDRIRVPTLIVHAQDDPFIPFTPFARPALRDNPWLRLLTPERGGHVGFFAAPGNHGEPDRYWAENRALAFCAAACGLS